MDSGDMSGLSYRYDTKHQMETYGLDVQYTKLKAQESGTVSAQLMWFQGELAAKKYELEQCAVSLEESKETIKNLLRTNHRLEQRLHLALDDCTEMKVQCENKVARVQSEVAILVAQLNDYKREGAELDKMFMEEGGISAHESSEALSTSSISSLRKRRLRQSLALARKTVNLGDKYQKAKSALFFERDQRRVLEEELSRAKFAMKISVYPTTDLLSLIRHKDRTIQKLRDKLKQTQVKVEHLDQTVASMNEFKCEIEDKLEELTATTRLALDKAAKKKRKLPWALTLRPVRLSMSSLRASIIAAMKPSHPITRTKLTRSQLDFHSSSTQTN